jgi:hypothetical protein
MVGKVVIPIASCESCGGTLRSRDNRKGQYNREISWISGKSMLTTSEPIINIFHYIERMKFSVKSKVKKFAVTAIILLNFKRNDFTSFTFKIETIPMKQSVVPF